MNSECSIFYPLCGEGIIFYGILCFLASMTYCWITNANVGRVLALIFVSLMPMLNFIFLCCFVFFGVVLYLEPFVIKITSLRIRDVLKKAYKNK